MGRRVTPESGTGNNGQIRQIIGNKKPRRLPGEAIYQPKCTTRTGLTAMTDTPENTTTPAKKQPNKDLIGALEDMAAAEAPPPTPSTGGATALKAIKFESREYNAHKVENFIDRIYHAGLLPGANIVTCVKSPRSAGWWAQPEEAMYELLETSAPKSLYISTSSFTPDTTDGRTYHRQVDFSSLHLIVLDDIGTKVKESVIPKAFKPSYKLETSEGNWQWGYILTKPVEGLGPATALVQLVYESGASDDGGKLPNKWVRMPEGINGKDGKGGFVSRVTEINEVTYTPQEIIDGLNLNANWEEVLVDADEALKRRGGVNTGTSPWSPLAPTAQALNGFIDPVLEWLYSQEQVMAYNGGEYFDVVCPQSHLHSDGNITAGYSPIGYCSDDVTVRRFNCFHGSCSAFKTPDFLSFVATTGGPEAGMYDPAAELTSKYVFDAIENKIRDLKSKDRTMAYAPEAFNNMFPNKVQIETFDGKSKRIPLTAMWRNSPARVVVHGSTFDASTNARLIKQDGMLKVNLFAAPSWGNGPIDLRHIEMFEDFIGYLIPDEDDRHYFLQTIAAKCQDMSFRGTAMVMIGHQQGLGRSTLADMIETLLGAANCATEELANITGDSQFNEWREKAFVVVEEAKAVDGNSRYGAYEKLKTYVDPRSGQVITINSKHEKKRSVVANTSFLFLSNHANALAIPDGDRRFYVMENVRTRRKGHYFTALNEWLQERDEDGMPLWGRSVYRWLSKMDVDKEKLVEPPKATEAKNIMAGMAKSDIDFAAEAAIEMWPSVYVTAVDIFKVLESPLMQRLEFERKAQGKFVTAMLAIKSTGYGQSCRNDDHPTPFRPRALTRLMTASNHVALPTKSNPLDAPALTFAVRSRDVDFNAVATAVNNHLAEHDR